MNVTYTDKLLETLDAGRGQLTTIKNIMIQSTGNLGDTTGVFYDEIGTKKYAHFVVGAASVFQYQYLDASVFLEETAWTNKAKALFCDPDVATDTPSIHTIVVEICLAEGIGYDIIEKNAITFLAKFLVDHDLIRSNVWRREDLIDGDVAHTPQYKTQVNWNKFLNTLGIAMEQAKLEEPDYDLVPETGIEVPDPVPPFEPDTRDLQFDTPTRNVLAIDLSKEDLTVTDKGGLKEEKNNFTEEINLQNGQNWFEPIYPDLTTPPRNSTLLYNLEVSDTRKIKGAKKPVLGKSVNNQDPYPVDDKIIELEQHYPATKIEDTELPSMEESLPITASYLLNLSQRTEKRLVQLENVLATMMRYTFRMGSRMNVNCVYYGGQDTHGKYNCIRCLQDDLVNDGAVVSIDQCMNCSRYEPIIGQIYEILSDDMRPSLAPILDDLQAARMSDEDYIKFTRIEKMNEEEEAASTDVTKLGKKDPEEKTINEMIEDLSALAVKDSKDIAIPEDASESERAAVLASDNFKMDWTEVMLPQMPDVNIYDYNDISVLADKKTRLASENKYYDGYKEVKKKDIALPNNCYDFSSVLGVGGVGGPGGGCFIWPLDSKRITSPFGLRDVKDIPGATANHQGLDIGTPDGSKIYASAAGTVIKVYFNNAVGHKIILQHENDFSTGYQHLQSIAMKVGDVIQQGQVIALSGHSGVGSGPHLHFEIKKAGVYVDPELYVGPKAVYSNNSAVIGIKTTLVAPDLKAFKYSEVLAGSGYHNFLKTYQEALWGYCQSAGISYLHMLSIICQESNFDPTAQGDNGGSVDCGLCQINSSNHANLAKRLGGDVWNPFDNMRWGVYMFADACTNGELTGTKLGYDANKKMQIAVSCYNQGVRGTIKSDGTIKLNEEYIKRHADALVKVQAALK